MSTVVSGPCHLDIFIEADNLIHLAINVFNHWIADREIFLKLSSDRENFQLKNTPPSSLPNELNPSASLWHLDPSAILQDWPVTAPNSGHTGLLVPWRFLVCLSDEKVCIPPTPVSVRRMGGRAASDRTPPPLSKMTGFIFHEWFIFFFLYASISQASFLSVSLLTIFFKWTHFVFT